MGMLRTIIVLGAGFALMPTPPPGEQAQYEANPGRFSYVAAAAETMADMRSFCQRNPNVCATAGAFARTAEGKAKYSVKLLYEWADAAKDNPKVMASDPVETAALTTIDDGCDTLTDADKQPKWRRPKG
jgi:Family of unknown function (DUF5330)